MEMNKPVFIKRLSLLFFVIVLFGGLLYSEPGYLIKKTDDGSVIFIQRLEWEGSEYAFRYVVSVEKKDTKGEWQKFTPSESLLTEDPFISLSLKAGSYRYRVETFDFLDRSAGFTEWVSFSVKRALQPKIDTIDVKARLIPFGQNFLLSVNGSGFAEDALVSLINTTTGDEYSEVSLKKERDSLLSTYFSTDMKNGFYVFSVKNGSGLFFEYNLGDLAFGDELLISDVTPLFKTVHGGESLSFLVTAQGFTEEDEVALQSLDSKEERFLGSIKKEGEQFLCLFDEGVYKKGSYFLACTNKDGFSVATQSFDITLWKQPFIALQGDANRVVPGDKNLILTMDAHGLTKKDEVLLVPVKTSDDEISLSSKGISALSFKFDEEKKTCVANFEREALQTGNFKVIAKNGGDLFSISDEVAIRFSKKPKNIRIEKDSYFANPTMDFTLLFHAENMEEDSLVTLFSKDGAVSPQKVIDEGENEYTAVFLPESLKKGKWVVKIENVGNEIAKSNPFSFEVARYPSIVDLVKTRTFVEKKDPVLIDTSILAVNKNTFIGFIPWHMSNPQSISSNSLDKAIKDVENLKKSAIECDELIEKAKDVYACSFDSVKLDWTPVVCLVVFNEAGTYAFSDPIELDIYPGMDIMFDMAIAVPFMLYSNTQKITPLLPTLKAAFSFLPIKNGKEYLGFDLTFYQFLETDLFSQNSNGYGSLAFFDTLFHLPIGNKEEIRFVVKLGVGGGFLFGDAHDKSFFATQMGLGVHWNFMRHAYISFGLENINMFDTFIPTGILSPHLDVGFRF